MVRLSAGTARGPGVLRRRAPHHLRGHGTQAPRHGATERPVLVHGVTVSPQHSGRQGEILVQGRQTENAKWYALLKTISLCYTVKIYKFGFVLKLYLFNIKSKV